MSSPTDEECEDLLLSCRYGDLADIHAFVAAFSSATLANVRDEHGNTVLHMAAANGHTDVLAYLLPRVPTRLLAARNDAGSTALHWAAVNRHLPVARALVGFPRGPGAALIDVRNAAGRSPLGEAELAGWDEGARWFVQVMALDGAREAVVGDGDGEGEGGGDGEGDGAEQVDPSRAIEVDIRDAGGQAARTTVDPDQRGQS